MDIQFNYKIIINMEANIMNNPNPNPHDPQNQQQYHQVPSGHVPPYTGPPSLVARPGDGKATGSLICGIIALFCAAPVGIAGIILAIMARSEAGNFDSKATTGLILSIVAIVFSIIFWTVAISLLISMPLWLSDVLQDLGIYHWSK